LVVFPDVFVNRSARRSAMLVAMHGQRPRIWSQPLRLGVRPRGKWFSQANMVVRGHKASRYEIQRDPGLRTRKESAIGFYASILGGFFETQRLKRDGIALVGLGTSNRPRPRAAVGTARQHRLRRPTCAPARFCETATASRCARASRPCATSARRT
jgi:hypothetical protein